MTSKSKHLVTEGRKNILLTGRNMFDMVRQHVFMIDDDLGIDIVAMVSVFSYFSCVIGTILEKMGKSSP